MSRYYLLPGRLQPPHVDHLTTVKQALAITPDRLIMGLIVSPVNPAPPYGPFELEAGLQHLPERNPFTYLERVALLEAALDEALAPADRARVHIMALPRPETAWSWVCAIFPGERTWFVPDLGETFDDLKARYFQAQGDSVVRLPQKATTDGRLVRDLLRQGDPAFAGHLPGPVAALIQRWRHPDV